ncbi:hypothetical protein FIBSPDRAFT_896694 [Athelia psychrophila]|uniref:Uncharacterized protein n=1 Tax=Athelia psychrophila TaxID=1759441 RepID=A0A166D4W0_9AGAM|nr:hypothetical protein FIBSPDRAFT_896694 [Fibularhizoctonia sp. CBS 109695]
MLLVSLNQASRRQVAHSLPSPASSVPCSRSSSAMSPRTAVPESAGGYPKNIAKLSRQEAVNLILESNKAELKRALVPAINEPLSTSLSLTNTTTNTSVFGTAHSIFAPWVPFCVLSCFMDAFPTALPPDLIAPSPSPHPPVLVRQTTLLLEIYYDFTCQDLPPAIEDAHERVLGLEQGWSARVLNWNTGALGRRRRGRWGCLGSYPPSATIPALHLHGHPVEVRTFAARETVEGLVQGASVPNVGLRASMYCEFGFVCQSHGPLSSKEITGLGSFETAFGSDLDKLTSLECSFHLRRFFDSVTANSTVMTCSVTIFAVTQAFANITIGATMFSIVYFKCKPHAMPRSAMLLSMLLRRTLATGVLTSLCKEIMSRIHYLRECMLIRGNLTVYINFMLAAQLKAGGGRIVLTGDGRSTSADGGRIGGTRVQMQCPWPGGGGPGENQICAKGNDKIIMDKMWQRSGNEAALEKSEAGR